MDEKEAQEIVGITEDVIGCDCPNPEKGKHYLYHEAKGYLAGLEAERERVKPLLSAASFIIGWFHAGKGIFAKVIPAHLQPWPLVEKLDLALGAYTTPQNDGKRDSG